MRFPPRATCLALMVAATAIAPVAAVALTRQAAAYTASAAAGAHSVPRRPIPTCSPGEIPVKMQETNTWTCVVLTLDYLNLPILTTLPSASSGAA